MTWKIGDIAYKISIREHTKVKIIEIKELMAKIEYLEDSNTYAKGTIRIINTNFLSNKKLRAVNA